MLGELSDKCEIQQNETMGRYVKAKLPIMAGQSLLQEQPFVILACVGDTRCSNCYKHTDNYCRKCFISPLCSECKDHDVNDCNRLLSLANSKTKILEDLRRYPDCYGILKCLLVCENMRLTSLVTELWQLESHLEERQKTPVWKELQTKVVQPLLSSGLLSGLSLSLNAELNEDFLQRLCAIIDVNAFEIRAPDSLALRGLFLTASLFSHKCDANLNVAVDTDYRLKIYTNRDVQQDEILGHCYTNALLGTEERRQTLLECKYFLCCCERCSDPTEFGTHLSSFMCSRCTANNREGFLLPENSEYPALRWKCSNCSYSLNRNQVENVLEKVKEEIFHAKDDLRRYEILLAKLSTILHRNHYLVVDIKQNIASILRDIIVSSAERPGRRVYERKVRLCQELVMVLHALQPGISRLKAIALHELSKTSVEFYRQQYNEQEIDEQELLQLYRQCEGMLREASRMLLHEPTKSPEGHLVREIFNDLKELQLKQEKLQESKGKINIQ